MTRGTPSKRLSARTLRAMWSERTFTGGWGFPSDWFVPAVDAVCEAVVAEGDVRPGAERLGAARSRAGVGLGEALADIDVLADLLPSGHAEVLRRALSLGWADQAIAPSDYILDPITGLTSVEYLKVRLGEIYRGAQVEGVEVTATSALVVVRIDLSGREDWERALPLMLTGDALRTVFDGPQTLCRLGEGVVVVVAERTEMLPRRARLVGSLIMARTGADPDARVPAPRIWIESLPRTYGAALALLDELAR